MKTLKNAVSIAALMAGAMAAPSFAADVEVMHWWTSGGEAAAIGVLKDQLAAEGVGWQDAAVAGGGGAAAMTALKARVTSGNAPTAAQIGLMGLQEWAAEGLLGDLTPLAETEGWATELPPAIMEGAMYDGKFVGVPFNIHRANWLWSNAKIFADNGLTPPTTWDEFFAVGDKLKEKGIVPLALGGEPWQETILLEDAMTAVGGAEFYRKAFLELDPEALGSDQMVQAFDIVGKIRDYVDPGAPGRPWNDATTMVLNGKAAMQFMGDWAKGEIVKADLVPGKDILCTPAPGTAGAYHFNVDYFMMFPAEGEQLDAAAEARRRDHGSGLPGNLQPREGLDPGQHEREGRQVRRLRPAGDEGHPGSHHGQHAGRRAAGRCGPKRRGPGRGPGRRGELLRLGPVVRGCRSGSGAIGRRRPVAARRGARPPTGAAYPFAQEDEDQMSVTKRLREALPVIVMSPSLVLVGVCVYGFIAFTIVLSLTASKMFPRYDFVGLSQYARLFSNDRWHVAVVNMGIFGGLYLVFGTLLGLLLAILIDQRIRAEGFLRTVYLYPMALSFVVTGVIWQWLLNPRSGSRSCCTTGGS